MTAVRKYKETNLNWLPAIPSQWNIATLRWNCKVFSGGTPSKDVPEYWNSKDVPWLNSGSVNRKSISSTNDYISYLGFENSSAKWIKPGAVLMAVAGQGKTKGTVALLEFAATCNQSLAAIEPKEDLLYSKYLYYYLDSEYRRLRGLVGDDARDGLNLDIIKSIPVPSPSLDEQRAISKFLDEKTAKIDALIEKKQKLIELLREERQALINQAVTKGLDPNAKMKHSGIEWLGEMPDHWEIKKLRYLASVRTGSTPTSDRADYYEDGDCDWFTPSDFTDGLMLQDSKRKVTRKAINDEAVKVFAANSVLLVGIGATLGKVGIAPQTASANQQINAISFNGSYNPYYGLYFLSTIAPAIVSLSNASTLAILNQNQTKDIAMAVPPVSEQDRIVGFIQDLQIKTDTLVRSAIRGIDLLSEYRTSLITEAVAGKLAIS